MKFPLTPPLLAFSLIFVACDKPSDTTEEQPPAKEDPYAKTDALLEKVTANITTFKTITTIDHARLAGEEGVPMPPSVVTIYSDPAVNTPLIRLNPRVGLDLPQKVLIYEEAGKPMVAFPSSPFLAKRHELSDPKALGAYEAAMTVALDGIDQDLLAPVGAKGIVPDFGIVELKSDFPLAESVTRLKDAIMKEGDTAWFGEIDFKAEAGDEALPGATLLLFGAPKPGGAAMAKFPKLGLDAFCQKILVYEDAEGMVQIIFNDIVAMAKLHYGTSAKPHEVISGRLLQTFTTAIKKSGE